MTAPALIERFSSLAPDYDAVLCDVWGVVHNGLAAFPEACEALVRFREDRGTVVLITNAPRPGKVVMRLLDKLGVPRTAYDDIVSSGDVTRAVIAARPDKKLFHIGPERDLPIFDDLERALCRARCRRLCGVHRVARRRNRDAGELSRGTRRVARAQSVHALRATRIWWWSAARSWSIARARLPISTASSAARCSMPASRIVPIYAQAVERVAAVRGTSPPLSRVLAIGDSVRTDLKGASAFGVDCLFVTAGIHAEELGGRERS